MTNEMKHHSSPLAKAASICARISAWTCIISYVGTFFLNSVVILPFGVIAWISGITGIILGICALVKLNDEEKQESIWSSKTSKGQAFAGIITFPVLLAVFIIMFIAINKLA